MTLASMTYAYNGFPLSKLRLFRLVETSLNSDSHRIVVTLN